LVNWETDRLGLISRLREIVILHSDFAKRTVTILGAAVLLLAHMTDITVE